jgi:DNA-binding MurR/RpiR family transcriptional regulator
MGNEVTMNGEIQTLVDFEQIITDYYQQLTKSEKQIANYLRKNQEESAFLSAAELADRLNLSEATIVRFARTVGFDSYPAMREVLQENFRRRVTHSTRLQSRLEELLDGGDIFERMVASEIDYLSQALETVDRRAFKGAVDLMKTHKRIFVFGVGPSVSLVELMDIRLRRVGWDVISLTTTGREILEPLLMMNEQDLLFTICFFDVTAALELVLDYANEVNSKVIMLTDTLGSIIGDKADVVLAARRGPVSGFHSLVVPMTIINTLLLVLAQEDQEHTMASLDKLDELRERYKNKNKSLI